MRTIQTASAPADWHPADVIAALHKRHISLRQLAQKHNYSHINRVLTSRWIGPEQVIAEALGVKPEEIWPSRYADPKSRERAAKLTRKVKLNKPRRGAVPA